MNPYKKSVHLHLKQGLEYIIRPEKTENRFYTGAINCTVENAYSSMISTKQMYGKTDKRQAYHLIISFEKDETTPDTAFEIAKEFCEKYLAENYEAVYSVHNDTEHIHCHIIWNSVRFSDGYKYRYEKGDWERYIQPLVNEICAKYGLNTLDILKKKESDIMSLSSKDKEWDEYKNGPFVWNEQIKKDVDACIITATDFDMFIQLLEEKDYQVKRGKYISVKPRGMQRFRRLKTLGDEYSEEKIRQRIFKETITQHRMPGIIRAPKIKYSKGKIKKRKLTGLQKQYFALLYKLGKIKKRSYSNNYKYRQDIKKLDTLKRQYLFLSRYDIETEDEIIKIQEEIKAKIKTTNTAIKVLNTENEKYQSIHYAVRTIRKEKKAASFYKLGDKTFWKQNEKVETAKQVLQEANMTFKEAEKLEKHYNSLIEEGYKSIKQMKKEIRTSYGLLKDIAYRKEQAMREKEREATEQNKEKDKDKQNIKKK